MCFPFITWFTKEIQYKDYTKPFECSCAICGENYDTMEKLIKHMGRHQINDINRILSSGYGTVRCSKCWESFTSVAVMIEHPCATVISGLSPIHSYDSLESVLIHE